MVIERRRGEGSKRGANERKDTPAGISSEIVDICASLHEDMSAVRGDKGATGNATYDVENLCGVAPSTGAVGNCEQDTDGTGENQSERGKMIKRRKTLTYAIARASQDAHATHAPSI